MRTLRSAGPRAFGTAGSVTFGACLAAVGSGAMSFRSDAAMPHAFPSPGLRAALGAMHAVRRAVHGVSRAGHARTAVVHALRTVLRTAVHGMAGAMTGAAMRATAGRRVVTTWVMTTGVMAGLAVAGHCTVMLRAAVVLGAMLRTMHARSVRRWAVLRVFARLAVCRMFGAFRAGVAGAMCRVRAFVRVGFTDVRRRTMPLGARAGVACHFAMVIAVPMFFVPRLIGPLVIRASISFGAPVTIRTLGGVGPSKRRALHAGASGAGACRWTARSAGTGEHHAAQFANLFRPDDLLDLLVDLLHFFHVRRARAAIAVVQLGEQLVQLLGLFRADELFHPRVHFTTTRFHRGGHVGATFGSARFFLASFFAARLFLTRFVTTHFRLARFILARLFFSRLGPARFFFAWFVRASHFRSGFGRCVVLFRYGDRLRVDFFLRSGVFSVCGDDVSAKQCRQECRAEPETHGVLHPV